jgi:Zn-dependent metalloprotease
MVRSSIACIVPPDILAAIIREGTEEQRSSALDTLATDQTFRQIRASLAASLVTSPTPVRGITGGKGGEPHRTVYDQHHSMSPELGTVVRAEGQPPVSDKQVNEAYDGLGATYVFYWEVFQRNSIDAQGMPILGLVHYGDKYDNAFWDGEGHMYFGDGDGNMFVPLTGSLDVCGHELTHGVTQNEANLVYAQQSGALNESISDVFGSLVKQYAKKQTADQADWLIGNDICGPALQPALRSMKDPGHANKYDSQPADMDHYVQTSQDNGGVHTNSSIPNHAFYVTATTLGGNAWERAGKIWYDSLCDPLLRPNASFQSFARITLRQAKRTYGDGAEAQAVQAGWDAVKLKL